MSTERDELFDLVGLAGNVETDHSEVERAVDAILAAGWGKLSDARTPGLGYGIPYDPAPRASYPADDYECCANGSCEVCNPGAHRWNS